MNKVPVVIFLYNRLFDPLIQGNFWLYILDLLFDSASPVRFHVVTYEDTRLELTDEQQALVTAWKERGLEWTPLVWHPGTGLTQKAADQWSGFTAVARLRLGGARHIITLGSVAGTFAYLYARLLGMKLFLYQFEPHSEYAIDNGMWAKESVQYRISSILERRAAHFATVTASGTRFMKARLEQEWKVGGCFVKIPTVANDRKFLFDPAVRAETRGELQLDDGVPLLFYPGKFGGLYYRDETAWMFRWLHDLDSRLHFLIVTPHEDDEVVAMFERAGVSRDSYTIRHSDYPDIHRYFFAADFAVIAVPPGPSKKFISNIKVGEYLCAGLPFLITRGVSEDYVYAEQQGVGVVVDDFVQEAVEAVWPGIKEFLEMEPEARRRHCRQIGLGYRGFEALNPRFRTAVAILVEDAQ